MNSRRPMSSANGPQPCRQEITSKAAVRTGAPGARGSSCRLVGHDATARPGGNATGVNFFTAELAAKRHWMDDLDRKAPMMGAEVGIDYNAEVQK